MIHNYFVMFPLVFPCFFKKGCKAITEGFYLVSTPMSFPNSIPQPVVVIPVFVAFRVQ